jgi:hypothetical protein
VTGPWVRIDQVSTANCTDLGRKYPAYGADFQVR